MIKFNELSLSGTLTIDASVMDYPYYSNVYISEILIDNQDTYVNGTPSESAISVYSSSGRKNVKITVQSDVLDNIDSNMFFVYIKTVGAPAPDTPCGMDNEYTIGVVYNKCIVYNILMKYVREINDCEVPANLIDKYLLYKAIDASINTRHYHEAISLFKKLVGNGTVTSKPCNCHG